MVFELCMSNEKRITKLKLLCLLFAAFVWDSRTLGLLLLMWSDKIWKKGAFTVLGSEGHSVNTRVDHILSVAFCFYFCIYLFYFFLCFTLFILVFVGSASNLLFVH